MLFERLEVDGTPTWVAALTPSEKGVMQSRSGDWHLYAIGSLPAAKFERLSRALRGGADPGVHFGEVWSHGVAHCALFALHCSADMLVVAVDPYAIAKVYTTSMGGCVRLSTNLPHLLRTLSSAPLPLEPEPVMHFFVTGHTPANHTFYTGIQKTPPGTLLRLAEGTARHTSYLSCWSSPTVAESEYVAAVGEEWHHGVAELLSEYGGHGVCLSGGLDSSLLVGTVSEITGSPGECVARTGISRSSLGSPHEVLNPFDQHFSRRVASHYGVHHEEVEYDWLGERVVTDFVSSVEDLGTESAPAFLFKALAPSGYQSSSMLMAAQNADSVLSFALIGSPRIAVEWPPVIGLGGWCSRYNLFGGLEQSRLDGFIVRYLLRSTLRSKQSSRSEEASLNERFLGLTYHDRKWPSVPRQKLESAIADTDALLGWLLREYVEKPGLAEMHQANPHAAFLWLFLHGYMQGSANRSTAWPTSLRQVPTYLPWASLRILQLTAEFRPRHRSFWYGKYPAMVMARQRYRVPRDVMARLDPPTPRLNRLVYQSFLRNENVRELLVMLVRQERCDRLRGILRSDVLDDALAALITGNARDDQLVLLFRLCWFLQLEAGSWPVNARRIVRAPSDISGAL